MWDNILILAVSLLVMDTPRVLILGHSFIRRLKDFIHRNSQLSEDFHIPHVILKWHGIGGRTIRKVIRYDLRVVREYKPNIVILQLGTNDLTTLHATTVGSEIDELVRLLYEKYDVKLVCVCQTIDRETASPTFARSVRTLSQYLRVVLEPLPYALYWSHRGFWNTKQQFLCADGVHLNTVGQFKFYRSLRGAVLKSLKVFQGVA